MPSQYYPRRVRVIEKEEKQVIKRLVITVGLIVILGAAVFFGGIPALLSLGNFFNSVTGKNTTPPQEKAVIIAPRLDPLADATNSAKITITGSGQAGTTAQLFINDQASGEQTIGNDRSFSFANIQLREGTNNVYAQLKDKNGQTSNPSQKQQIIYDATPPVLTVDSPQDNQTINGNKSLTVTGKTDPNNVTITINDAIATSKSDGSFSTTISLNPGASQIKIVATDEAQNQTTIVRNVVFNP